MRKFVLACAALALVGSSSARVVSQDQAWALNATVIEACTCPMFCQCYFDSKPAGHHHHDGKTRISAGSTTPTKSTRGTTEPPDWTARNSGSPEISAEISLTARWTGPSSPSTRR